MAVERAATWYRRAIGGATLVMLALSWPLWVDTTDFPRVPFALAVGRSPSWVSWLLFGLLLGAIALLTAGVMVRRMLGLSLVTLVVLVLGDQHRFQPWTYQYAMAALALATTTAARSLGLMRLFTIALYAHSGLSKLDMSFLFGGMGLSMVGAAGRAFGLGDPTSWSESARFVGVLLPPASELAIAVGLVFPRSRRTALAGAIVMHLVLIGTLGPSGAGHSTIVLVWNAAMIVEDVFLFGSDGVWTAERLTTGMFVLAAILPFGERRGWLDTWPAFALYSGHGERTEIIVDCDDVDRLPPDLAEHIVMSPNAPCRLDPTNWSREVRGVPVYPQNRARNGLAEAVAARYPGMLVRVVHWGRADRWSGRRQRIDLVGLEAIRRHGDRYRINAHPAEWRGGRGRRDER